MIQVSEVVGIGKVEPEDEIVGLAAYSGGVVKEIYKNDGDRVSRDEPILRLDDDLETIRIAQLKNQMVALQTQIKLEEIALRETEVKLDNKSRLLSSFQSLVQKGAETTQNLDDLDAEVKTLSLNVEKGRFSVILAQNRLSELVEQIRLAEAEAQRKVLRSPYDGILLEMHVNEGSAVSQFANYAEVAPAGNVIVRAEVDELFADRILVGLPVEIRYVGSSSPVTDGEIFFLSPYLKKKSLFSGKASEQEDRLVREVRIRLNDQKNLLLNSKVECIVKLNSATS